MMPNTVGLYSKEWVIKALNMWMDDYIKHPDEYEADFQTIMRFLEEQNNGEEPSYGDVSFEQMCRLMGVSDEVRT